MTRLITFAAAARLTLVLFILVFLFHLAVVAGILFFDFVPIEFLWGGRMQTREELLIFEVISLTTIGICLFLVMVRAGFLQATRLMSVSRIAMWLLFVLFLLNTVGNIVAKTSFEKSFAVLTALLAFLMLRLALEKPGKQRVD